MINSAPFRSACMSEQMNKRGANFIMKPRWFSHTLVVSLTKNSEFSVLHSYQRNRNHCHHKHHHELKP